MKTILRRMTLAVFLTGVMATASAQSHQRIYVHLPFDAEIGQITLPAGHYLIEALGQSEQPVLSVMSQQGGHVLVPALRLYRPTGEPWGRTELVLVREEDSYRVTEIRVAGRSVGYEIPRGKDANSSK